jgi:uncharacterized protein YbbC (DUF1343 family)
LSKRCELPKHSTGLLPIVVLALLLCPPGLARVKPGLDILVEQGFAPLDGKRIGLITAQTGLTRDRRRNIDVLVEAPGVKLTAIFSPEHGITGQGSGSIADSVDEATGIPIYSLYNEGRYRPTPEMLRDVDALVFDIHHNGARFMTHITILGYTMEAASERQIPFYVLDRPNGINGVDVGGPLPDEEHVSFVGYMAGMPVRHGMTVGELARMYNGEKGLDVDLHVIPMRGWKRAMWYDETGLEWVNPSPNIRNLTQATLYPGVCLLEGRQVSVGRGTEMPFQLFGAPWYRAREVVEYLNGLNLPGVRFLSRRFRPNASVYRDEECEGVDIQLVNREVFDPVLMGLELLAATIKFHPDRFDIGGAMRLLGNNDAAARLRRGETGRQVQEMTAGDLERFLEKRARYLLYE